MKLLIATLMIFSFAISHAERVGDSHRDVASGNYDVPDFMISMFNRFSSDDKKLHAASGLSDSRLIKHYLNEGFDANKMDRKGNTPLHHLLDGILVQEIRSRDTRCTTTYMENRPDKFWRCQWTRASIKEGRENEGIEMLLNAGADINAKNKEGQTPLDKMHIKVSKLRHEPGVFLRAEKSQVQESDRILSELMLERASNLIEFLKQRGAQSGFDYQN